MREDEKQTLVVTFIDSGLLNNWDKYTLHMVDSGQFIVSNPWRGGWAEDSASVVSDSIRGCQVCSLGGPATRACYLAALVADEPVSKSQLEREHMEVSSALITLLSFCNADLSKHGPVGPATTTTVTGRTATSCPGASSGTCAALANQSVARQLSNLCLELKMSQVTPHIGPFNGERHHKFQDWLKDMEKRWVQCAGDDERMRSLSAATLTGPVALFPVMCYIDHNPQVTWDQIKVVLKQRYSDLTDVQYARQSMGNLSVFIDPTRSKAYPAASGTYCRCKCDDSSLLRTPSARDSCSQPQPQVCHNDGALPEVWDAPTWVWH